MGTTPCSAHRMPPAEQPECTHRNSRHPGGQSPQSHRAHVTTDACHFLMPPPKISSRRPSIIHRHQLLSLSSSSRPITNTSRKDRACNHVYKYQHILRRIQINHILSLKKKKKRLCEAFHTMAIMAETAVLRAPFNNSLSKPATRSRNARRLTVAMCSDSSGKKKTQIKETLLTPRFYTTDFDEMEALLDPKKKRIPNEDEFVALLGEFRMDYNQNHFVRSREFKEAADSIRGPFRKIFVEFLERSCTAEFSGFLLYKEIGRRLKKSNPIVAEIFSLMSRDEARHAGFLNKGLADFNLALDLGFLTKARKYTLFKPQYILYATYLSEKIGYWRYITICRHLMSKPEHQVYPIFKYFENWCQDENRHGDFIAAMLKVHPQFLNGWKAKLWARFFCLSVYVTMYLNDHQRSAFYDGIGLNTKEFDMHVLIETNKTTARIFPAVLDVENPEFKRKLDRMVNINQKINAIQESNDPQFVKNLKKFPLAVAMVSELVAAYLMRPVDSGSVDFSQFEPKLVY